MTKEPVKNMKINQKSFNKFLINLDWLVRTGKYLPSIDKYLIVSPWSMFQSE